MKIPLLFLVILSAFPFLGQSSPASSGASFLLDHGKPYVYLAVEGIVKRTPRSDGEPDTGIWLYLHNNCNIPIVIQTFGVPPGARSHEIGVFDNVVSNPEPGTGDGSYSYRLPSTIPMGAEHVETGGQRVAEGQYSHPDGSHAEGMPHGYMYPVSSSVIVPPGKSIYFSLPRNHVSKAWHVEIPFSFALKNTSQIRVPSNRAELYEEDLKLP